MDLFVASDYQLHRPLGNRAVQKKTNISDLSMSEAEAELTALSLALNRANHAYHSADTPSISDAEYDRLKQRNLSIETVFPELKRRDSPTDQVGAAPADGFAKLQHKQRMLSS